MSEMPQMRQSLKKMRGTYKPSSTRKRFLEAFEKTFGNVSASCEYAGIHRATYYRWIQSPTPVNQKFREDLAKIKPVERQLDFLEGSLMKRVADGDTIAIIFGLKTLGRKRGYGEKTQDLNYQLVLRAVARIERILTKGIADDPTWQPDVKDFLEEAALDFGVDVEEVTREFEKRQTQKIEGVK